MINPFKRIISSLRSTINRVSPALRNPIKNIIRNPIINLFHKLGASIEKTARSMQEIGYKDPAAKLKLDVDTYRRLKTVQGMWETINFDTPIPDHMIIGKKMRTPRKYWYIFKADVYQDGELLEKEGFRSFWDDRLLTVNEAMDELIRMYEKIDSGVKTGLDNIQPDTIIRNRNIK